MKIRFRYWRLPRARGRAPWILETEMQARYNQRLRVPRWVETFRTSAVLDGGHSSPFFRIGDDVDLYLDRLLFDRPSEPVRHRWICRTAQEREELIVILHQVIDRLHRQFQDWWQGPAAPSWEDPVPTEMIWDLSPLPVHKPRRYWKEDIGATI